MLTTTTPGDQRVSICTCTRTGRHLATFTCRPGSSRYAMATEPPHVAVSAQVSVSDQVAPPCSCRLLSHQTLLWHHRLGHPSLPRLRGMHSCLLVSGLLRSLPPLPPSPAPPCLPCVEGQQRAAPHSSSFPPTTTPLQTLHMDVWGPACVSGRGRERYFLLVVNDYTRYTTVFPLRSKGQVVDVLIPWIHAIRLQLRERFHHDLPILRLHSNRGGEFSSNLAELLSWGGHSLVFNLWPRVSLPETSPTLRWTGEVGDASVFRVWGSSAFVRDSSADKLSARAIPCVFLGFPTDAPGWQFYHPTNPLPPQGPATSGVSQVDPLPGTMPVEVAGDSGAARGTASRGAESGGAEPGGAESEGAGSRGAEHGGAEPAGAEPAGVEPGGAEPEGVEPGGAESEGAESRGAESRGAASSGGPDGASPRLSPRPEPLSPQQLREWLVRCARLWSGAARAGATEETGDTGAGGAEVTTGAGGTRGTSAAGLGGARTRGAGAGDPPKPKAAKAGGTGAGGTGAGAGAGGVGAGGTGAGSAGAGGAGAVDPGAGGAGAGGAGGASARGTVRLRSYFPASSLPAPAPYTEQSGGLTKRREPSSCPILPNCTARQVPRWNPPPVPGTHAMALRPSSVPLLVPLPSPPESTLPAVPHPESDLVRSANPTVSHLLATVVTDPSFASTAASALVAELVDFAAACRLDYGTALEDFECLSAAVPRFASMLLAPEGDPNAPDTPTPHSYTEAITALYSSQWQEAMDAKMASSKTTGTYVDTIPPSWANIVDGMWIFRVKRPSGSPPAFQALYIARGFSQRQGVDYFQTFSPTPKMTTLWVLLHVAAQRDYELYSLDFSTAFLHGSLHEEIWLRRLPGFTGSFPASTQSSLRRQVYGLRQAPREWHDTLRTTLAALGFAPSTVDLSLFLRTDTSLLPFYIFVYLDLHITRDRARHTITPTQSHMVHQVLLRFGFEFSSPQPTPLSTNHSLSAPPSDESVEPSGSYPELVGCLMYLMSCIRLDLAYPLSLLACYVAPGRHQKVHWDAAKRVLHYLCSTLGMGLVLGGRGPLVHTGHADAS
ncbi:unnamed protein product [Closterium sp. NIES-54]